MEVTKTSVTKFNHFERLELVTGLKLFSRGGVVESCFSTFSPHLLFICMHEREKGALMIFKSHFSHIFQAGGDWILLFRLI
jgi:hypothetical protein